MVLPPPHQRRDLLRGRRGVPHHPVRHLVLLQVQHVRDLQLLPLMQAQGQRRHRPQPTCLAGRTPRRWLERLYAAVVAPDHPYSSIGSTSVGSASTAYGLTVTPAVPALPAPRAPRCTSRSHRAPARDDSPSAASRIFLDARRSAASYSSRFTDVTNSA